MLCENCHKKEATEVFLKDDGYGGKCEIFVCPACARQLAESEPTDEGPDEGPDSNVFDDIAKMPIPAEFINGEVDLDSEDDAASAEDEKNTLANMKADVPKELLGPDGEPPEFVKNLLNATIGFIKGVTENNAKLPDRCAACGKTLKSITADSTLGCPECWNTYGDFLKHNFLADSYGPAHVGEAPASSEKAAKRAGLERRYKAAMAREDFRKAAEIKAKIEALDNGGGNA